MSLDTLHLSACPVEDQAILKFWRELQASLSRNQNPAFARTAAERIETYFHLRAGLDLNLRTFMERFQEDFDGAALNKSFSKEQLELLRQIFLQRSHFLFLAEEMERPIPGDPHDLTSGTLGRVLNAIARPPEQRASDAWSAL